MFLLDRGKHPPASFGDDHLVGVDLELLPEVGVVQPHHDGGLLLGAGLRGGEVDHPFAEDDRG